MEERRVLATYVVETLIDDPNDGARSLQEAVAAANLNSDADTIEFAEAVHGETLVLTSTILITNALSIVGPGPDKFTIDGNGTVRLFEADDQNSNTHFNVHFEGLTLQNGFTEDQGGGIKTSETLSVTNVDFQSNVGRIDAGAISSHSNVAETTIRNSRFIGNSSPTGTGAGVTKTGTAAIKIYDSEFVDNTAASAAAISTSGASIEIYNSSFVGNSATSLGGGVMTAGANLTIQGSTFASNKTPNSTTGSIWHFGNDSQITIENSTFIDNMAQGGSVLSANSNAQVTISHSTFLHNRDTSEAAFQIPQESILSHNILADNGSQFGVFISPDSSYNLIDDPLEAGGLQNGTNGNSIGFDWKTVVVNDGSQATLADNGGPTSTIAILENSLAHNSGDPNLVAGQNEVPATDQRGADRVLDAQIDIGAFEFGDLVADMDYGDAPNDNQTGFASSYPTLLEQDGARHVASGPTLGNLKDIESDGLPTADASGDGDDEDGVHFFNSLIAAATGTTAAVEVTASEAAKLDAWIDFNQDGDWDDAGEHIFASKPLEQGTQRLSFDVAADAAIGTTYARFRISSEGGLAPTGLADNGEVEDYAVEIQADSAASFQASGETEVKLENGAIVLMEGGEVLWRSPIDSISELMTLGTSNDDEFMVTGEVLASQKVRFYGDAGRDSIMLSGNGQDIRFGNVSEIEELNIAEHTLTISPEDLEAANGSQGSLRILQEALGQVVFEGGWGNAKPEVIGEAFGHVIEAGDLRIESLGGKAFQNPVNFVDSNFDGAVSAVDALTVINSLNTDGSRELGMPSNLDGFRFFDPSGDNFISSVDALIIINFLNRQATSEVAGEGEFSTTTPTTAWTTELMNEIERQRRSTQTRDLPPWLDLYVAGHYAI